MQTNAKTQKMQKTEHYTNDNFFTKLKKKTEM